MNLLLDTHIWVWSVSEPQRLSRRVARQLDNTKNQLWLSPVSIWETLMLHRKGRLKIPEGFSTWMTRAMTTMPLSEAPLTFEVAEAISTIHLPHSDPADLFLAASAKVFGLTLVTSDERIIDSAVVPVLSNL
jgi:PIN domain nuclease of toxin-antitoxin system